MILARIARAIREKAGMPLGSFMLKAPDCLC